MKPVTGFVFMIFNWLMLDMKTRSVGQIIEHFCKHSEYNTFHLIIRKVYQNVCLDDL